MPDIITSAFGPEITWHQCWIRQSSGRGHQLRIWWRVSCISWHNMHILLASQVISVFNQMFATINSDVWRYRGIHSLLSHIGVTAEACVCNTLAISLSWWLASMWDDPFSVARHDTDVTSVAHYIDIKEVQQQGPPQIIWSDPAYAFPYILVYAIDPIHGLFEMYNSIDMGDPHWLANHLVDVCMCFSSL